MIISLNWLKKYVNLDGIATKDLAELIGARLVEIEGVEDNTHKYDNIFIARVVEAEKIPDTHLTKCQIVSGGDPIQVLCGAPNVHEGMLAVWIAPGAVVPSTYNTDEHFEISVREIRGQVSNGMLAGIDELDLGEDHSGIVELPVGIAEPGAKFSDIFDVADILLDIENKSLTHRPDCFGIIGFAREVAGILDQPFQTPDFMNNLELKTQGSLDISIEDPALCPRYSAAVLENFSDEDSTNLTPDDIQLIASGMRPISTIVDITNYLMLLTGQPLHAFDYDKLVAVGGADKPKIIVRAARPGESMQLLDGREIELTINDILITSNDIPVALAGAMGGASTAIDANTKRVVIESATFSLYNIRKTSMHHGIFSEAVTRFTKGQPAALTAPVLNEAVKMLEQLGMQLTTIADAYPNKSDSPTIAVSAAQINATLGSDYSASEIERTLSSVNFLADGDKFTAPYWRTDIHIPEDIIEEVGRLRGYDNIPQALPTRSFTAATSDRLMEFKSELRDYLSALGANETLTYGFVSKRLLENAAQDPANSYTIINSISPALEFVRQSITPSLLDKAYVNLKAGYDSFALFEMNQVFQKSKDLTDEQVPVIGNSLAFVIAAANDESSAYYSAKRYADQLFKQLGISAAYSELQSSAESKPFEPKRSATITTTDGVTLGVIGELSLSTRSAFKLPVHTAAFELDTDTLLECRQSKQRLLPDSWINRDLTVTVAADEPYAITEQRLRQIAADNQLTIRISPASIYQNESADDKKVSFHLQIAAPKSNLTRNDINKIMEKFE